MIALAAPLIALLATGPGAGDTLYALALHAPDSTLAAAARAQPLAVRDALDAAQAHSVRYPANSAADLLAARRIAAAYAAAWDDPFLVREAARFASWPRERRLGKVWVDSMRRAGKEAFPRAGAAVAIGIWRRAAARARFIADTASLAAVLGNIGTGFLIDGELDSAEKYVGRAKALAATVGDRRVEANALGDAGGISQERGDLDAARRELTQALAIRERIGDWLGAAVDHNNLGLLAQELGDLAEARRQFESALAINRREQLDGAAATNLVNLAGLASLAGDFAVAAPYYREALRTWVARGEWADAADAYRGLGQLELRRGDYRAAEAALREAVRILDLTGPPAAAVAARTELALALAAAGTLQGAVDELIRARRMAEAMHAPPAALATIALARADLAVQLNTVAEADRRYIEAAQLFRQAKDPDGEAEALQGRGGLAVDRGDFAVARRQIEMARLTQRSGGHRRGAAISTLLLGRLATAEGDTARARRELARATAEFDHLHDPVGAAAALGEWAGLDAQVGLPLAAETRYRAALHRLAGLPALDVSWRLHYGLALALAAQHAPDAAARELRLALAEIDRSSAPLTAAERRAGFLEDKWPVYAALAMLEIHRGRADSAFAASERLRAREMLEVLERGHVGAPADTAADLVQREQDLRRRLSELRRQVDPLPARRAVFRGAELPAPSVNAVEALRQTEDEYGEVRLEIEESAPSYGALLAGTTAPWHAVAQRLGDNEALVEYLVSDSGSLAFVVTHDTLAVIDLGVGRQELRRLIEFTRGTMEPPAPRVTDSLWRAPLRRLNAYLIAPLEASGVLARKTTLTIVPHAELHYLPFAALLGGAGGGQYLVERYVLDYTPSASVWLALRARAPGHPTAGLLALAPRPDALPASREEVASVGRSAGEDASVLTDRAATEAVFRREAPSHRVLYLATYGVLDKRNPMFSFVELAPDANHDGRLEVQEVFGLHLNADLVVLSACETAVGSGVRADVPAGDDWVGLTRAFLSAGAAHVVATLWPVEDRSTARIMEQAYVGYAAGEDPARSLADAQRAVIARAGAASHPFYWAGFVVTGK